MEKEDAGMNELKSLSYEELLCFMRSAPASIFLKDTQCKYRFVSNLCGLAHGGTTDGILGRTDLEIQADPALGREYYEDDLHVLATGQGSQRVSRLSLPTGPVYLEIKKNPVVLSGAVIGIIGVMRVGGDEFLILCPKCSSDQAAELIARIRRRLAARSDGILTLDVAFGSYTAQDDSLTFDQVFHRADRAMHENKKDMHRTQVQ